MIESQPFYAEVLCFSCTRCSSCCRYESGFVFLSQIDVLRLAAECQISYNEFVKTYCRWIPSVNKTERLSLREKADFDCIFWDSGCKVYNARPLQCRAYPFWPNMLNFRESWEMGKTECPGMDQGKLYTLSEIEAFLDSQSEEKILTRNAQFSRSS